MVTEIQKAQIVKMVVLLLVGTLYYSLNAQTNFDGTYCKEYDLKYFSDCLTFEKERNFKFEYSGDTGVFEFGEGEYQIIGKHLILKYNKTEPIEIGHHVAKIWTNNKDSINLQFNIFDFDGLPLPAVTVVYEDSLSKYDYTGVTSNKKGIAIINLKKDRTDLQIEISHLGFELYKFSLDKNYNYNIYVFLQREGDGLPIKNQIDTLEIQEVKLKYFTVKNKDGSKAIWRKTED